jgi:LCP family protein required for cell wall assembly
VGIFALAAGAFYTALVVATQIDQIFFPGNEIKLGSAFRSLPGIDKSNTTDQIGGGRINVLVMGVDVRPHEGNAPSRTDTMFVMNIDPATNSARGIGIPRDLMVDIPTPSGGKFQDRINSAYIYGESRNYPGGGIKTVETAVENLLNIKIDYYVMINFEGFRQIIDLLGGIEVTVPENLAVDDPYYSETERLNDFYPCVFKPGVHQMNGSDALCYSRTRFGNSDLDRILRQQLVMFAVAEKAKKLNFLNPDNLVSLWKKYKNTVTTDINDQQVGGFARLASQIDATQMSFLTLGACVSPYTTSEGAAVLVGSKDCIGEIVRAFKADDRLNQEAARVEVQNGTTVQGRAGEALKYFAGLGMAETSMVATNASDSTHVKTEIIDFSNKSYTSTLLASWLGVPKSSVRKATEADAALRSDQTSDIVVILGPDAKIENALAGSR